MQQKIVDLVPERMPPSSVAFTAGVAPSRDPTRTRRGAKWNSALGPTTQDLLGLFHARDD